MMWSARHCVRQWPFQLTRPYFTSSLRIPAKYFRISEEVRDAVATNKPVVALETTIYTHGFSHPENISLSALLESTVRAYGGVPVTIGILGSTARVGFSKAEMQELLDPSSAHRALKVSRRDLPFVLGSSGRLNGGTTVSATSLLAYLAGIRIFATGGIGGVHKGGESSLDISADLIEIGRTPVAVVSSGCKSFLDIPRTLEVLETNGVFVGTFADGRLDGEVAFPAFWTSSSGVRSPHVVRNEVEAAGIVHAMVSLGASSGVCLANPIAEADEVKGEVMEGWMEQAVREATEAGIRGRENTPWVLRRVKELSVGLTVEANRKLVVANVIKGTKVAVELAKIMKGDRQRTVLSLSSTSASDHTPKSRWKPKVVVAGALAVDLSCTFTPLNPSSFVVSPNLHTSNPAMITPSIGGVGANIATALHYLDTPVALLSATGADIAGYAARSAFTSRNLSMEGVVEVGEARTAQYVAVNDKMGNLMVGMADMGILENERLGEVFERDWRPAMERERPEWVVLDANWPAELLSRWIKAARRIGAKIAFEPVSVEKSIRVYGPQIFGRPNTSETGSSITLPLADIITPNLMELQAMARFTRSRPQLHMNHAMRFSSDIVRDITMILGPAVEDGVLIIQAALSILSFFGTVVVKLGPRGVVLLQVMGRSDPRLNEPKYQSHLALTPTSLASGTVDIGAVYARNFPVPEVVPADEVVSVNGVGDTLLGVLIAGLVSRRGARVEELIQLAQRGAGMTLRTSKSVGEGLSSLVTELQHSRLYGDQLVAEG